MSTTPNLPATQAQNLPTTAAPKPQLSNHIAQGCLDRLRTALTPTAEAIKDFILTKTKLNGRVFTFKNHEYQEKIVDLLADPDIDLVIEKPSQTGISEVIYRVMLARVALIRGFSAAIVFPTRAMSNEVFSTRVNPIIAESPPLQAIRNPDVDSSSVKMFNNNSIIYALGASTTSKSTVINRPIRTIIADELARCDIGVITSMRSRQRHQDHKSSIYFSTPLFEGADIDAEMQKCGVIWEQLLNCRHCRHQFFPDFYENTCLPGYDDDLKRLKQDIIDRLNLDLEEAYLKCPKCGRPAPHEPADFTWVDTSTHPNRPKIGLKLSAYCMPHYVTVPRMVQDMVAYADAAEFKNQVLGLPATKAETAMDTTKIVFESGDPGSINVWGLDLGRICHLMIATVTMEKVFVHTRVKIPLKDIRDRLEEEVSRYNCIAGVMDSLPYTDLAVEFINKFPNSWAAAYVDPSVPTPELFKLKLHEDSDFGNVRQIQINKNLFFDTYANELMGGRFVFRDGEDKQEVISHHEGMRRLRNPKYIEFRYMWVKMQGSKTMDHYHHVGIYTLAAARLMTKASASSLPLSMMMTSFKPKCDI